MVDRVGAYDAELEIVLVMRYSPMALALIGPTWVQMLLLPDGAYAYRAYVGIRVHVL